MDPYSEVLCGSCCVVWTLLIAVCFTRNKTGTREQKAGIVDFIPKAQRRSLRTLHRGHATTPAWVNIAGM